MINLEKYKNEPEFQTALKEMFSSLDEKVLNNPRYHKILEDIEFENIDNIDMTYDTKKKDISQMNEDIAKDRYSRYIGAMGMDAVQQQSNSNIFISVFRH